MRFEMSINDVQNLVWVVRFMFDYLNRSESSLIVLDQAINSAASIIRKIRDYGYESFRTRDEFRETMNGLNNWLETTKNNYLKKQKSIGKGA